MIRTQVSIADLGLGLIFYVCFGLDVYGIGQAIIFSSCGLLSFFLHSCFSSPNLSGRRLDVYHSSTHGVALVRI